MKVDFRKIEVTLVDGSTQAIDISKELANLIYQNTREVSEASFAMDLYKNGEVEVDEPLKECVKKYASNFVYFVSAGIEKALAE